MKVNRNTVYDLIRSGNLIALKLGRLKITKVTLLKFLEDFNRNNLISLDGIKELTKKNRKRDTGDTNKL